MDGYIDIDVDIDVSDELECSDCKLIIKFAVGVVNESWNDILFLELIQKNGSCFIQLILCKSCEISLNFCVTLLLCCDVNKLFLAWSSLNIINV